MKTATTTLLLGLTLVVIAHAKQSIYPGRYSVGDKVENVFTYIGSSQGRPNTNANGVKQDSIYFISEAMIAWKDAQEMCINVLGNEASLLSLEEPEEHEYITHLLANGSSPVRTVWTEGKYWPQPDTFRWARGHEVDDTFPWGTDQPSERLASSRILMVKGDNGNWTYESRNETEQHPFICEFIAGSASEPVPCFITNDLILSLDSSGSVSASDYEQAKRDFVLELATQWNQWEDTKISLQIFATTVLIHFNLGQKYGDRDLATRILNAPKIDSGTHTHLALDDALKNFDNYNRFVQRNLVVLTDGQSNMPDLTIAAAKKVNEHEPKINVYSVGIGQGVVDDELLTIAGGNKRHVFSAANFQELKNLLKPMSLIMCEEE